MWMAGLLAALPVGPAASTTEVEDDIIGGPLGGAASQSDSVHHRVYRRCRWRSPWGALPADLATSTTGVEDDIDGGPPWWHYRLVRQRPPPSSKMTPMAAPLGGTAGWSGSVHDRV
jgi:hypothetical protein